MGTQNPGLWLNQGAVTPISSPNSSLERWCSTTGVGVLCSKYSCSLPGESYTQKSPFELEASSQSKECGCFFRLFTQLHSTLKLKLLSVGLAGFLLSPFSHTLSSCVLRPAQNLLSSCCLGSALTGPSEASSSASPTALEVLSIFQGTNLFHPLGSMGLISHKNPCPILRRAPAPSQTTIF